MDTADFTKHIKVWAEILLLGACLAAGGPVGAEVPAAESGSVSEVVPLARMAMGRVGSARTHLHEGRGEQVKQEIEGALAALDAVAEASPSAQVRRAIRQAQEALPRASGERSIASLEAIGRALALIEEAFPRGDLRRSLIEAEDAVRAGRVKDADSRLEALGRSVVYFQVDVPVRAARTHLLESLARLRDGESRRTDEDLELAQERLQSLVDGERSRFNRIHRRIGKALAGEAEQRSESVLGALEHIAATLASGGKGTPDPAGSRVAREAMSLREGGGKDASRFKLGLRSLWRLCFGLAEWEAEKLALGLRELSREREVFDWLIEAKLRLLYGEHRLSSGEDMETVLADVQAARRALQRANANIGGRRRGQVGLLLQEILRLEDSLKAGGRPDESAFEDLTSGLRIIIRDSALPLGEWNPEAAADKGGGVFRRGAEGD